MFPQLTFILGITKIEFFNHELFEPKIPFETTAVNSHMRMKH